MYSEKTRVESTVELKVYGPDSSNENWSFSVTHCGWIVAAGLRFNSEAEALAEARRAVRDYIKRMQPDGIKRAAI